MANITLQAVENGVTTADRLARVDIRGSDVFVQGTVPGNKVKVDVEAPTPTLQQMSDHLARQTQAQEQERGRSLGMQTPTLAA